MRLRAITTSSLILGLALMLCFPLIFAQKPAKISPLGLENHHHQLVAFSGLVLSYSAATILFFVAAAFFALLIIMEMRDEFAVDRQRNLQAFVEEAQVQFNANKKPDTTEDES